VVVGAVEGVGGTPPTAADKIDWIDFKVEEDMTVKGIWGAGTDFSKVTGFTGSGDTIVSAAMDYLQDTATAGNYVLAIDSNKSTSATKPLTKTGVNLTIRSTNSAAQKITLTGVGPLFTIGPTTATLNETTSSYPAANSLILKDGITLESNTSSNNAVVHARFGASFTMEGNSKVTANKSNATTDTAGYGSAVHIEGGNLFMKGSSEISGNESTGDLNTAKTLIVSGVLAEDYGKVSMEGTSKVKSNTTTANGTQGIYVTFSSTIELKGSAEVEGLTLSTNTANDKNSFVSLATGWTGRINPINLRANFNALTGTGTTNVAYFWTLSGGKEVLKFPGTTKPGTVTLGKFMGNATTGTFVNDIGTGYEINGEGKFVTKQ
jgi:hypothetical protein